MTLCFAAHAADRLQESFIRPQENYKEDPRSPPKKLFIKNNADLKKYKGVIIEPLVLMPHFVNDHPEILKPTDTAAMASYFLDSFQKALLAQRIALATEPGPGIARITVTVVDVIDEKPGRTLLDYTLLKASYNLARVATGHDPVLVRVSVLGQLEDSQSNSMLGEVVNLLTVKKTKSHKKQADLAWIKDSIDLWTHESAVQLAKQISTNPL